jgi:hypothetical protein
MGMNEKWMKLNVMKFANEINDGPTTVGVAEHQVSKRLTVLNAAACPA